MVKSMDNIIINNRKLFLLLETVMKIVLGILFLLALFGMVIGLISAVVIGIKSVLESIKNVILEVIGKESNKINYKDEYKKEKLDKIFRGKKGGYGAYKDNSEDVTIIEAEYEETPQQENNDNNIISTYITYIQDTINKSSDNEINEKLNTLKDTITAVRNYLDSNSEHEDDIKLMTEYYVPELLEQITKFINIKSVSFMAKHGYKIKNDILETIDMVDTSFNTILSEIHDGQALSVSASLEALKAGMRMKGLGK